MSPVAEETDILDEPAVLPTMKVSISTQAACLPIVHCSAIVVETTFQIPPVCVRLPSVFLNRCVSRVCVFCVPVPGRTPVNVTDATIWRHEMVLQDRFLVISR